MENSRQFDFMPCIMDSFADLGIQKRPFCSILKRRYLNILKSLDVTLYRLQRFLIKLKNIVKHH